MTTQRNITFFHAPNTRSTSTFKLLEELGAPYELRVLNIRAGEQHQPAFLAVNPLGKVPTILDGDTVVTEQSAIFIHLADRFPQARLAPSLDDPRRGAYLRWIVYYAASYEPALIDRFMKYEPLPQMQSPYRDFDSMLGVIEAQLARSPYLLGDTLSAADILWGVGLAWGMDFGIVPERPVFKEYAARIGARAAAKRVDERDAALAAEQAAQAGAGAA